MSKRKFKTDLNTENIKNKKQKKKEKQKKEEIHIEKYEVTEKDSFFCPCEYKEIICQCEFNIKFD